MSHQKAAQPSLVDLPKDRNRREDVPGAMLVDGFDALLDPCARLHHDAGVAP
eukprot:CAMPEP_0170332522 /NCGR_PEP_ID=MMETSP0116_2-20130129/67265_1 /TAXON_ID=400756 /ORGANISM="Durinskia baltica, Strain CSIRO CS-38" /LENGTH=51 /DNA_ID=CAMNT_0010585833 /DNA_START=78 /DNA_END=233 /DNA_ORIENTATION=+